MTDCAANPQAVTADLMDFAELVKLKENLNSWKRISSPHPPDKPHLYAERDVYGMEYFHWPAWVSCQAMLPPNSLTEHGKLKKVLIS